uniref:Uncharacterized protein n=1 Tax=Plectus sambesii TaxID=2011161 RepID=A0A914W1K4_9BILA
MSPSLSTIVFLLCIHLLNAKFTEDFNNFLTITYGAGMQQQLERNDLGNDGSFGGRSTPGEVLPRRAVILVHGITNKATTFRGVADHFVSKGYLQSELYATTWGDAGKTKIPLVSLNCAYVKQVRNLIIAVRQYTGQQVDVIGYSMGSPVARKAILGGYCVDTRENLGAPLTDMVDTFIGVAGANYGSALCIIPIPGTCNQQNGLSCGSQFLTDINRQSRYEGRHIYAIYSTGDDVVGYQTCGQVASAIPGMDGGVQKTGLKHNDVVLHTSEEQYQFIVNRSGGTVGQPPVAAGGGGGGGAAGTIQTLQKVIGGASGIAGFLQRLG